MQSYVLSAAQGGFDQSLLTSAGSLYIVSEPVADSLEEALAASRSGEDLILAIRSETTSHPVLFLKDFFVNDGKLHILRSDKEMLHGLTALDNSEQGPVALSTRSLGTVYQQAEAPALVLLHEAAFPRVEDSSAAVTISSASLAVEPAPFSMLDATTAPTIDHALDQLGSRQGVLDSGSVTDDSFSVLEGTGTAGSVLEIVDGSEVIGEVTVGSDGRWRFEPDSPLNEAGHVFTAHAKDGGEASNAFVLVVDSVAPNRAVIDLVGDDTSGALRTIAKGAHTTDSTPLIAGSAEAFSMVALYNGKILIGTTFSDAQGKWSFNSFFNWPDGEYKVTAQAVDFSGNTGLSSAAYSFTIDTIPPIAPVITQAFDNVGVLQGELLSGAQTDDKTPTLAGTAEAGTVVEILDNGVKIGEARVNSFGYWDFTPSGSLAESKHQFTALAKDAAGNKSALSAIFELTVDATAPNQPSIDDAQDNVGAIQGSIGNGKYTDDTTPTLSGQGEPGSTVHIYNNGADLLGSVKVGGNGKWTFTPATALPDGKYSLTAINEDKAGNVSKPSEPYVVIVDTLAPTQVATLAWMGKDSGSYAYDCVTNDGSAGRVMAGNLTAALKANESLQVSTDNGKTWGAAYVSGTVWWAQDGLAHDGNWTIQTRVVDAAGNLGPVSNQAVTLDMKAPDAPGSISVAAGKVTVGFDAGQMVAGDLINIISGGKSMDYTLSASDIAAGRATITPSFVPQSDLVVAMVDRAGNTSDYVRLEVARTVTENFTNAVTGKTYKVNETLLLMTMSVKVLLGQTLIGTYSDKPGYGDGNRLYFGYSGVSGDRLEISPTEACKKMSFTTDWVHNAATYSFYDTAGNLLKTLSFAGNPNGYKVSYEAPEGQLIGKVVAYTNEWGFMDNFVFETPEHTQVVGPLVVQDIAANAYGTFHGSIEDNLFKIADVAVFDSQRTWLDGGEGIDTLKLLGGGQILDLTALVRQVRSVEILDITGTGNNTLKLSVYDVLENGAKNLFTGDDNVQLMVKGNAGDRVELSDLMGKGADLGNWLEHGQVESSGVTYNVYQHSGMAAELLVQSGVDVTLINHG